MAFYEIRTLITRKRTSLVSFAEYPNDLAAILAARALLRRGESLEILRGETLVYRIGPAVELSRPAEGDLETNPPIVSAARRGRSLRKRAQALFAALGLYLYKRGL